MSFSIAMKAFRLIVSIAVLCILCACGTAPNAGSGSVGAPAGFYTVAQGDTLSSIARRFRQSVRRLVALNDLKDANDIKVGQLLRVDPARAAGAARTRNAPAAAASEPAEPVDTTPAPRDWIWPADGTQTARFGQKKGIEIAGKSGAPVRAANVGKVSFVGGGIRGYGNLIIIRHTGNLLSVYAHNKVVIVQEGETVAKGQKIAEMGDSDSSTVKLYFEIRRNGKPVDPADYLPAR